MPCSPSSRTSRSEAAPAFVSPNSKMRPSSRRGSTEAASSRFSGGRSLRSERSRTRPAATGSGIGAALRSTPEDSASSATTTRTGPSWTTCKAEGIIYFIEKNIQTNKSSR